MSKGKTSRKGTGSGRPRSRSRKRKSPEGSTERTTDRSFQFAGSEQPSDDAEAKSDDLGSEDLDDGPRVRRIKYRRPWLYPKQEEAIFYPRDHEGRPARISCIEAGTKTGKTVGCIAWLFENALVGPPGNYWWVAPVSGQARIAFTRMKASFTRQVMTPLQSPSPNIALPGDKTIWFKSAEDPDNLYGDDVQAMVIDEASRVKEPSWHACRSTLTATRGPLRAIGNVKGRKNWFYALSRRAESGERGYSFHRIVAADAVAARVLAAQEIEEARRDLPEKVFNELYLAMASDDGGNPFGLADIAKCVTQSLSSHPVAVWGWDLAKSVDWTVGVGLDQYGRVAKYFRFQRNWESTVDTILKETGYTQALVDSTGVGDPIVERLQKVRPGVFEGYHFTQPSKQRLMEGLAVSIQRQEITVLEGPMRNEMEEFEYVYTRTGVRYSAPEGYHDDCVCALALANIHLVRAPQPIVVDSRVVERARRHKFVQRTGRLG